MSERTAELMKTQADLAHLSQVYVSMGELAASIAHEISQPFTAVVGPRPCMRGVALRLSAQRRESAAHHGKHHSGWHARGRGFRPHSFAFQERVSAQDWLDMNEVIGELTSFCAMRRPPRHTPYQHPPRERFAPRQRRPRTIAAGGAEPPDERHGRHERLTGRPNSC